MHMHTHTLGMPTWSSHHFGHLYQDLWVAWRRVSYPWPWAGSALKRRCPLQLLQLQPWAAKASEATSRVGASPGVIWFVTANGNICITSCWEEWSSHCGFLQAMWRQDEISQTTCMPCMQYKMCIDTPITLGNRCSQLHSHSEEGIFDQRRPLC